MTPNRPTLEKQLGEGKLAQLIEKGVLTPTAGRDSDGWVIFERADGEPIKLSDLKAMK